MYTYQLEDGRESDLFGTYGSFEVKPGGNERNLSVDVSLQVEESSEFHGTVLVPFGHLPCRRWCCHTDTITSLPMVAGVNERNNVKRTIRGRSRMPQRQALCGKHRCDCCDRSEGILIFASDSLNAYVSATLVYLITLLCDPPLERLGEKGKHGVLKDKESRKSFLENKDHRIRFVCTPTHCSWLNQIEIWFSGLGIGF